MAKYSWFRMYSEWLDDAKIQMLSPEMQRHHVALLCLRCQQPTEAMSEAQIAFRLRVDATFLKQVKAAFLQAGFIDEQWAVINWPKRQFLSDCSTARVRKFRERQALKQDVTFPQQREMENVTVPYQNRSQSREQMVEQKRPPARGARLSLDFKPSASHADLATKLHISLEEEFEKFSDHWHAKAGKEALKVDWNAALRTWLRRAAEFSPASADANSNSAAARVERSQAAFRRAAERSRGLTAAERVEHNRAGFAKATAERLGRSQTAADEQRGISGFGSDDAVVLDAELS